MNKTPKTITSTELRRRLFKSKEFQKEYHSQLPELQLASQIIEARIKKNLSQVELANRINSGQAVISRLESMNAKPSLSLLTKVAKALDTKFHITIG